MIHLCPDLAPASGFLILTSSNYSILFPRNNIKKKAPSPGKRSFLFVLLLMKPMILNCVILGIIVMKQG